MKVKYKGYEINVTRERCMGGWDQIYYSIFRISDLFECCSGFCDTDDTVRDFVGFMKERINAEHETDDPWNEKADECASGDRRRDFCAIFAPYL